MIGAGAVGARRPGGRAPDAPARAPLGDRALEALLVAMAWSERRRQRRRLLELAADPDFLSDVGLSRADALAEGRRPFWVR